MRAMLPVAVMATLLAVYPAPPGLADEGAPVYTGDAYSVVELAQGESVTIPRGYDVGLIEEKPSQGRMSRSSNTAPDCIQARMEKFAVQVYNNCVSDMRVKVIMTANTSPILGAKDSACKTIAAGTRANVRWIIRVNEKVDRVELC